MRWHYQWVVVHDFLARIVGREMVDDVLFGPSGPRGAGMRTEGFQPSGPGSPYTFDLRFYRPKQHAFMPVEFSVAAYRLGHSMIRAKYDLNNIVRGVPIFLPPTSQPGELDDLRGFRPLPGFWTIDWRRFLQIDEAVPAQSSRRIDSTLSPALKQIPAGPGGENSLAFLNLVRGWRLGLPSGQAVARAMGAARVYSNDDLGLDIGRFGYEAPLWFYILMEAEIEQQGRRMGPVGGRIVAEVFLGLAKHDPNSFFNVDPHWTPDRATFVGNGRLIDPVGEQFELRDIVRFAGVEKPPF